MGISSADSDNMTIFFQFNLCHVNPATARPKNQLFYLEGVVSSKRLIYKIDGKFFVSSSRFFVYTN